MKKIFQDIFLFCASAVICLLLCEFTLRCFVKPSPECYGILFNAIELPPFTLKIGKVSHDISSDQPPIDVLINQKITPRDLSGVLRPDPELGDAPAENTISSNGWWQSNNLGARSSTDTTKNIPEGKQRVIIFGDSYTNGHGLPGKKTWTFLLNDESKAMEFVNFGVEGYSMGQCLLRYEMVSKKIDYDIVMLVFVPSADLPREINVLRQLQGWPYPFLVPRFVIENGQLKLVKSPYKTYHDLQMDNKDRLSGRLKKYLQAYDRLYFNSKYESPPFWGDFIFYKLWARWAYISQNNALWRNMMAPGSEAMTVSLKIFEKMNEDVGHDGKKFVLVVLPIKREVMDYNKDPAFRQRYDTIISSINKKGVICIDLMNGLSEVKFGEIDLAYDGTHYGPQTSKIISEILWHKLKDLKLIVSL